MNNVGVGTRVLNFVVDTLLVFVISYVCYEIRLFYVVYYRAEGWPFYYFFWAILPVYYLLFELLFGRTPGKWLTMSKVVNANGKRASVWQLLLRSLLRLTLPVDFIFISFTGATLHDYATKTAVVEA